LVHLEIVVRSISKVSGDEEAGNFDIIDVIDVGCKTLFVCGKPYFPQRSAPTTHDTKP
jgi:hypothetical protein